MTANLNTLGKAHSRLNDNASHHDNTAGATGFDTDYPQSSADNGGVWVSESSYSSTTQVAGEEPRTTGWRGHEEGVIDAVSVCVIDGGEMR